MQANATGISQEPASTREAAASSRTGGKRVRNAVKSDADRRAFFAQEDMFGVTPHTRQSNAIHRHALDLLRNSNADVATVVFHDLPRLEHEVLLVHVPRDYRAHEITDGSIDWVIPKCLAQADLKPIERVQVGDRIVDMTSAGGYCWHTRTVSNMSEEAADPALEIGRTIWARGAWDGFGHDLSDSSVGLESCEFGHGAAAGAEVLVIPKGMLLPKMMWKDGAIKAIWPVGSDPGATTSTTSQARIDWNSVLTLEQVVQQTQEAFRAAFPDAGPLELVQERRSNWTVERGRSAWWELQAGRRLVPYYLPRPTGGIRGPRREPA